VFFVLVHASRARRETTSGDVAQVVRAKVS
jgi:hypothetical protein